MRANLVPDLGIHRGWCGWADGLLAGLRACFAYGPGDDRATGCLYAPADGTDWPGPLAAAGPVLLYDLETRTGVRYGIAVFQAYRDGSGCGWHADTPFGAQAVLSLGVTRTFGVRLRAGGEPSWLKAAHGDLLVMPDGFQDEWEHCVPEEDVAGERCSVVFRTARGD